MNKLVKKFWKSEDGVTALEYGLIAVVIAVSVGHLGTELDAVFTNITSQITSAV